MEGDLILGSFFKPRLGVGFSHSNLLNSFLLNKMK